MFSQPFVPSDKQSSPGTWLASLLSCPPPIGRSAQYRCNQKLVSPHLTPLYLPCVYKFHIPLATHQTERYWRDGGHSETVWRLSLQLHHRTNCYCDTHQWVPCQPVMLGPSSRWFTTSLVSSCKSQESLKQHKRWCQVTNSNLITLKACHSWNKNNPIKKKSVSPANQGKRETR